MFEIKLENDRNNLQLFCNQPVVHSFHLFFLIRSHNTIRSLGRITPCITSPPTPWRVETSTLRPTAKAEVGGCCAGGKNGKNKQKKTWKLEIGDPQKIAWRLKKKKHSP